MQPDLPTAPDSQATGILQPYLRFPRLGYIRDYRSLRTRKIGSFSELKSHLQETTAFLSLHIKFCRDGRIAEIGMAFLPSIGREMPADFKEFAAYAVYFCCLRIRPQRQHEREIQTDRLRWLFEDTAVEDIDIDSAEAKMIEFLEYIRDFSDVQHLTFIGFDMDTELKSIFYQMPAVVHYISAWVDIQPIIWGLVRIPANHGPPSMSVAMAAFAGNEHPSIIFSWFQGNDAVHILDLFTCLTHTPSGIELRTEQLLHGWQTRQTQNILRQKGKRSLYKNKVFIIERYPFRALLCMQDGKCSAPEIYNPPKLQEYFEGYPIEAISQEGKHIDGHPDDGDCQCGRYIICFHNTDYLAKFVKENNQRTLECGRKICVFEMDSSHEPIERNNIDSPRNSEKEREDGLSPGFLSSWEDMHI